MIFAGARDVFDELAPISAVQLQAAFARGTDERNRETRIVRHRDRGRFAVAGMTLDADSLGVYRRIGFKIIECPARSPSPGSQCAPIVELAGLTFVNQT